MYVCMCLAGICAMGATSTAGAFKGRVDHVHSVSQAGYTDDITIVVRFL